MTAAAALAEDGSGAPVGVPLVADRAWFDHSAAVVAPALLGALLIRDSPDGRIVGRIVEVEAYLGPEDLAAHSSHGRTPRNAVMFGPPGHLYVYVVYGMHHCANVVCGPGAKPEAVLLRAVEVIEGAELARRRRGSVPERRLGAGPGNLAAAFGIDRSLDGADLLTGPIRFGERSRTPLIDRTPRVGVGYADDWSRRPLRFVIHDDPYRSRR